ncbi:hypothetical protein [Wolbachia endosymbiont (group A) of Nomada ferruginata]|uniref:hypothetical protein n=1 Tax=Wolbachia endosymbiont (group A) of Nomada ferruginata TaxID=3066204 RepID=UPI00334214B5
MWTTSKQKYSWSTVFAWLYLKTIGRILPKKWNKWAENILYCDKTTESNEIRTDDLKTTDESAQIDLKPEVAVKESQSEVMSEDEGIQTEVSDEFIDEDYDSMEEVSTEEDEELQKQLEDVSQELELERSQNVLLKEENEELRSKLAECEKDYTELEDVSQEFLLPVGKYINKLKLDKESEKEITSSMSGNLSEKAFAEGVVRVKMRKFSDNVQELASSIRDKFLSPNQKMCSRVLGERNTYQLSANKASTPSSSMSHTNTASIYPSNRQKIVKVGS